MSVNIVRTLPQEKWRRFVEDHPTANVFHTPEMFQVFAQTEGYQPTLWAAVDNANQPLALFLPVYVTLKGGLLHQFTTRAIAYGGVLSVPDHRGEEALKILLQAYNQGARGRSLFTEMRNLTDLSDLQPVMSENDFVFEGHLNYLINLERPEETVWGNLSKNTQKSVRKSRNKGTVIEEVVDREKVAIAYQLLREIYAYVQVPLASYTLFEAAFDILAPRNMFKILLARVDQQYVGVQLLLMYKGRVIAWYGGAMRAFSSYRPNELMIWHVLQWGLKHNFQLFDFGGAGHPDEDYGPREFKAKFGGELVNYGRATCIHFPLAFKFAKVGYEIYRKLLS